MAALSLVADYSGGGSSGSEEEGPTTSRRLLTPMIPGKSSLVPAVSNPAPMVLSKQAIGGMDHEFLDPKAKELTRNLKVEELFAPSAGPENPFKSNQQKQNKNMLTGFVEEAHFNAFRFESERRTYDTYGYALDPSANSDPTGTSYLGDKKLAEDEKGASVFDGKKSGGEKRRRERNMDPTDVEGYTGPWGKFVGEETVSKPEPELLKEMEEFAKKRKKRKKFNRNEAQSEENNSDEKSILHIKDVQDYQGRTFMMAPQDIGVNLREDAVPSKCFIPKKQLHTYSGHNKGVQVIRWFPKTAHMFLSGSMDSKIKLWEVYKGRKTVRSYLGHKMAVRDLCFNNSGTEFLSSSFDKYIKVWDTETGECKQRFTTGKVPFCVKYNPDEDKQHMFLAGMQDKKILQYDLRSGEVVQEYDRHLGAVNTITFFDNNRRFCSTSDDKSLRIWEWEIPVDTKLIQDSSLHSMPTVTMSPNHRWLVGQAMDNRIVLFQFIDEKLRFAKKKAFKGHMVAGYACSVDFSPDMSYIASGDADGRVFIWDWKNHKIAAKWKAHDNVCIGVLWHPHESSKVLSCGWDGNIKLWD